MYEYHHFRGREVDKGGGEPHLNRGPSVSKKLSYLELLKSKIWEKVSQEAANLQVCSSPPPRGTDSSNHMDITTGSPLNGCDVTGTGVASSAVRPEARINSKVSEMPDFL